MRGVVCRGDGTYRVAGINSLLFNGTIVGNGIDKKGKVLGVSPHSNVESSPAAHEMGHEVEGGR